MTEADIRELDRQVKMLIDALPYSRSGPFSWLRREWASTQMEWNRMVEGMRPPVPAWVVVLVAVLYLLCPIDLISDQAGLAGFLDDLLVLIFATVYTIMFS